MYVTLAALVSLGSSLAARELWSASRRLASPSLLGTIEPEIARGTFPEMDALSLGVAILLGEVVHVGDGIEGEAKYVVALAARCQRRPGAAVCVGQCGAYHFLGVVAAQVAVAALIAPGQAPIEVQVGPADQLELVHRSLHWRRPAARPCPLHVGRLGIRV